LFVKNQKEIDAVHLAELKNKIKDLKQTLAAIEGEFKQKGKLGQLGNQKYYVREGSFFNAFKYSEKINNVVRSKALGILDILEKLIPFIPNEVFKSTIEEFELVEYFPFHYYYSEFKAEAAYPASGFESTPISSLIGLCEGLDRPEVVRELQKPLYVALAYIFSRKKDSFSKSDFPELKPTVFDCAVDLALKKGWIAKADQKDVYKINEKPEFKIKCPFCEKIISAYAEYCAHCGLYLLNMITREQKNTKEDIPHDFYIRNEKENKWIAYFKFDPSKKTEICGDLSLKSIDLYPFLQENAIEIPDYTLFAELYAKQIDRLTNFVNLDLYPYRTMWFKVSGRTIEETQQKLIRISSSLKSHAEELYKPYKVIIDAGGKYTGMDDFVKDVVMMWKDSLSPKLDEHPIFRAKETSTKVLICPNCGSEMPLYAKYCGHCGYELSSVKLFG